MKYTIKIMAFAIAFTMLFASQVTAFAATTSSKTVTSSKAMSVALLPGVTQRAAGKKCLNWQRKNS